MISIACGWDLASRMRSSLVDRASDCQCISLQRSWVRSQHPSAQWNLRGGRWSSVEYGTKKNPTPPKKIPLLEREKDTVPHVLDISVLFRERIPRAMSWLREGGGRGEASVTNVLEISFLSWSCCTGQKMLQLSRSQYNTQYSTFSS
jgi:hypothetical protein